MKIEKKLVQKAFHLGHKSFKVSKTNFFCPFLSDLFVGSRNSISVFNSEMSLIYFMRALYVIALVSRNNKGILLVNTNPDYERLVKNVNAFLPFESRVFSVNSTLVSGTLSNWKQIQKSVISFAKFQKQYHSFLVENKIVYPRYIKMKKSYSGFLVNQTPAVLSGVKKGSVAFASRRKQSQSNHSLPATSFACRQSRTLKFSTLPALVFILNPHDNISLIQEAKSLHIPVIAFTNSQTNLSGITYPIPINSFSLEIVHWCMNWLCRVIKQQRQ